jgi:hypothetical protein
MDVNLKLNLAFSGIGYTKLLKARDEYQTKPLSHLECLLGSAKVWR